MTPDPVGGGIGGGPQVPATDPAVSKEDLPHRSTDPATPVLGVRNDVPNVLTDADGDYSLFAVDEFGRVLTVPSAAPPAPAPQERLVDGDHILGAGTITIPDGVIEFGLSVKTVGGGVTLDGPDFAAPITLFEGQSISKRADDGNTLNGPITITTTAASEVNATWVKP